MIWRHQKSNKKFFGKIWIDKVGNNYQLTEKGIYEIKK